MKQNDNVLAPVNPSIRKATREIIETSPVTPFTPLDCFPIVPDQSFYWSFAKQIIVNPRNGIDWPEAFGDHFLFESDGFLSNLSLGNLGIFEAKVYRLRVVNGGAYITADINPFSPGGNEYFLGTSRNRIVGFGQGVQRFVLFSIDGKYRLLMPNYGNKILYLLPNAVPNQVVLSQLDYGQLTSSYSRYDQPFMYILPFGELDRIENPIDTE